MTRTERAIISLLEEYEEGRIKVIEGKIFRSTASRKWRFVELNSQNAYGYKVMRVRGHIKEEPKKATEIMQHRFLYALYHGIENLDPDLTIHHINYDKTDNRESNLAQVSRSENTSDSMNIRTKAGENPSKFRSGIPKTKRKATNLHLALLKSGRIRSWVNQQIGVSKYTFSRWLRGEGSPPSEETYRKLAELLNCDYEDVVGEYVRNSDRYLEG